MAEEPTNGVSPPGESGLENGLTPIHQRIHCAATNGAPDTDDELDQIDIDNLLKTLAEVALAIARRKRLDS